MDHSSLYALAVGFGTAGVGFLLTGRVALAFSFLTVSAFSLSLGYLLARRERRQEPGLEATSKGAI